MDFLNDITFPLIKNKNWAVVCGDILEVIKNFPSKIADVIITSPPYNLGRSSGGGFPRKKTGKWNGGDLANGYDDYRDDLPKEKYVSWQVECLQEMWRLIYDKGAIFYNHKPRIQSGRVELPTHWETGLPIRQVIIWKRNGGINFSRSFYLPKHEYIIVYAKTDFRLKDKAASGSGDVWEIMQEKSTKHPAPFPVKLPSIILKTIKKEKGLIIDPFSGSGTTGVAALRKGYKYIGIDKNFRYIGQSAKRLKQTEDEMKADIFEKNIEKKTK